MWNFLIERFNRKEAVWTIRKLTQERLVPVLLSLWSHYFNSLLEVITVINAYEMADKT